MTKRSQLILVFLLAFSTTIFGAFDRAPSWLQSAATQRVPSYEKDVIGVVLLDEQVVTVDRSGKIVTEERYAVKILTKEGRDLAVARASYLVSAGKVGDLEAWTLPVSGQVKEWGKKDVVDLIADPDDVYNEHRLKIINASDTVSVGDIFGYSVTIENPPLFYQDIWQFQGALPVLTSRYTLNLPSGWQADSLTFNADNIVPSVNGSTYTWQMNYLAPVALEPMSPSVVNLVPFIAVNFKPAGNESDGVRSFANWQDVSKWSSGMYDPQVVVNDEVAGKARELTAGAETELDKIRAIGKFVQNLQYISIDIGVAYGNGYRPKPSDRVLNRGYGDCKDKANLMRAMLRSLKIDSYPVAIYSGDPTFVKKEWPSPRQFNHCIIAVVVGKETEAETIIEHPTLGRLLIFDATDDMTPVGDLPDYLQGSQALIMAGEQGGIFEMPITSPEANALDRQVNVKLDVTGAIAGSIVEKSKGQSSKYERALYRSLSATDYSKSIEQWLTRGATAAKLESMTPSDDHAGASFKLDVKFSAPSYGQLMQGRLLVFKPTIVSRSRSIYLTDKERKNPVVLDSMSFKESAVFELPSNFSVDEMPESVDIKTDFGSYKTTYKVEDSKLVFTREMMTERTEIPVKDYEKVRDFFGKVLNAENSPVVLLRNN
ncbi:MAG: DUF3857 domain-containing protein [Pyrinomonadaceae bacterium]